jgi:hypothetical protein
MSAPLALTLTSGVACTHQGFLVELTGSPPFRISASTHPWADYRA